MKISNQTKSLSNYVKEYFKNLYYKSALIRRRIVLIFLDILIIFISLFLTFWISSPNNFQYYIFNNIWLCKTLILLSIPLYIFTGQYKSLTRFFDVYLIYSIGLRNIFLLIVLVLFGKVFNYEIPHLKLFVLLWSLISIQSIFFRLLLRDLIRKVLTNSIKPKTKVSIYGAGFFGSQLANTLKLSGDYKILNFIDNDSSLWSRKLNGLSIDSPKMLEKLIIKPDQILIALPLLDRKERKKIIENLEKFKIPILQVPSIEDLNNGTAKLEQLRPIVIEDLLGRDPVKPNLKLLTPAIKNKVICITGAGGSIGSELCRQICHLSPSKIILLERSEPSLYYIYEELKKDINKKINLEAVLGSAGDFNLTYQLFKKNQVDVIFHAAAYKHVPLVENNPLAGIKNNVFATYNICKAASLSDIKQFILISTDKAVRPTNVMGATKRLSEMIVQAFAAKEDIKNSKTFFSMVRFGNVLNSSGSVVPLFREQIKKGGPITITHPKIIRYFMTITEAAQLVIQAANLSEGGELFLLDMGEPVLIEDLAKKMIKLSGLSLKSVQNKNNGDIEITYTGLRPGEKLYEELLINGQSIPTKNPLIFKAKENFINYEDIAQEIELLKAKVLEKNTRESLEILKKIVPEWKSENW